MKYLASLTPPFNWVPRKTNKATHVHSYWSFYKSFFFFFFFTSSTPYSVLDVIKDDTSFVSLVSINKNFILSLKNSIDG